MDTPPVLKAQAPVRTTRQAPNPTPPTRQSPIPSTSGGGQGHRSGNKSGHSSSPTPTSHAHSQPHYSPDIVHLGQAKPRSRRSPYISDSDEDDDEAFVPIASHKKEVKARQEAKARHEAKAKEKLEAKPKKKSVDNKEDSIPLEPFVWDSISMSKFYKILIVNGFRPIGINRHFQMMTAHTEFCKAVNQKVDVRHLWAHLESLYDIAALEELEDQVEFKVNDFSISDIGGLDEYIKEKLAAESDGATSTEEDLPDIPVTELPVLVAEPYKLVPKKPRIH